MNTYGTLFRVSIYGESHGHAIGVILDGVPAGIKLDLNQINEELNRRRPGGIGTTPRVEQDEFKILSGYFNEYTTGSPLHIMIENKNTQSKDYDHLKKHPRPGHADFVADVTYKGFQDYRGGGHFSGRLTAALVIAGAIAKQIIPFEISSKIIQLGDETDPSKFDEKIKQIQEEKDSLGGIIEVKATHMIIGLGDPFFQKLDAEIAKVMFSIPAVKGVEIGDGFHGVHLKGSAFNDAIIDASGKTLTNHSGGVSGGISNGNDLIIKVMMKPASSIGKPQKTFDFEEHNIKELEVKGRHDSVIIKRAGVVLESALAICLLDSYLRYKAYH